MGTHFGARVIGREAADKAVRENKGGGNVFGKRVVGAITGSGPVAEAKRVTQHGPYVVDGAQQTGPTGKGEGVSIEELKNILAENPTFFDSLYEAELARPEGARPDALDVFLMHEIGIKGAGRQEITEEIRGLLGHKRVSDAANANLNKLKLEQRDEMQQRSEENLLLADADRARALRQREEDLKEADKTRSSRQHAGPPALTVEGQVRQKADASKTDIGQGSADEGRVSHPQTPAKPEGNVKPETQGTGAGRPDTVKETAHSTKKSAKRAAKKEAKGKE